MGRHREAGGGMTADEFEAAYAKRSGLTVERLRALGRVVRPCDCGSEDCQGWQSISATTAAEFEADGIYAWTRPDYSRKP